MSLSVYTLKEISFKFIPKILMSQESIHFFGPLCVYIYIYIYALFTLLLLVLCVCCNLYFSRNSILGDQTKGKEMLGYGGEENCIQDFGGRIRKERDHLQDLGVNKWMILKCIMKKYDGGVVWGFQASDLCELC